MNDTTPAPAMEDVCLHALEQHEEALLQYLEDNLVDSPRKAKTIHLAKTTYKLARETVRLFGVKPAAEDETEEDDDGGEE